MLEDFTANISERILTHSANSVIYFKSYLLPVTIFDAEES